MLQQIPLIMELITKDNLTEYTLTNGHMINKEDKSQGYCQILHSPSSWSMKITNAQLASKIAKTGSS